MPRLQYFAVSCVAIGLMASTATAQEGRGFTFNRDAARREALLGPAVTWTDRGLGDVRWFEHLSIETLDLLLDESFVDPQERQNGAPTVERFAAFMHRFPAATAHGYTVGPAREDYRVSLEGLFVPREAVTWRTRQAFRWFCLRADARSLRDDLYCWFD